MAGASWLMLVLSMGVVGRGLGRRNQNSAGGRALPRKCAFGESQATVNLSSFSLNNHNCNSTPPSNAPRANPFPTVHTIEILSVFLAPHADISLHIHFLPTHPLPSPLLSTSLLSINGVEDYNFIYDALTTNPAGPLEGLPGRFSVFSWTC